MNSQHSKLNVEHTTFEFRVADEWKLLCFVSLEVWDFVFVVCTFPCVSTCRKLVVRGYNHPKATFGE